MYTSFSVLKMTSFHPELLTKLDEHSLKETPFVIHLIYKGKKLSIDKRRKLYPAMLTTELHNYTFKEHDRRKVFSVNSWFSLPRSTSNTFRNRKSISEKLS